MKKDRRWLKSAIAASEQSTPAMPWQRGTKAQPASLKATAAPAKARVSIAAR